MKILLAWGLALAAAGCVTFHDKPVTAQQTYRDFDARRLDADDLKAYLQARAGISVWTPEAWDLKSLTLAAFYYHPDLDVARARWASASAGKITAGTRPNPSLSALLGYNSTTPTALMSRWIPELVLDIPLETAGKRGLRLAQAGNISESARLDILTTAWEVRARVRRALVDVCTSQESEALLSAQTNLQDESVHLLNLQQAAGEISPHEASQARIALNASRLAILEAGRRKEQARVRLAEALGVPMHALEGANFSCDEIRHAPDPVPPNDLRLRALMNRTDILGALADYAAAQAALQLEIAKQYPDIHIGPGYQLDQTDNKWTLGFSLELPIFNRNKGPIAEAEARRTEAASQFLALQARITAQINTAMASSNNAAEQFHAADALLTDLRKREETAKASFELGEISKLEYLGLRLETTSADLARIQALNEIQQAAGDLEEALQSPLDVKDWILETPDRTPPPVKEHAHE